MPAPAHFEFDVFLSHSSKDKAVVRAVAERLRADGLRVWLDDWEIRPGDSIPAKIEEALEHSRVLVLCMSANAFGSEWARLEAGTFRFRDPLNKERRFIPLRLDEAPIKGSLAQFLYIDWRAEKREQEYTRLLEACRPPATIGCGQPGPRLPERVAPVPADDVKETTDRILAGASVEETLHFSAADWKQRDRIYDVDGRGLITLRVALEDDRSRDFNALVLLVYGYKLLKDLNDVPIRDLRSGLIRSGYHEKASYPQVAMGQGLDANPDAIVAQSLEPGILRRHGSAQVPVYSLTEDGMTRARDILKRIFPKLD